MCTRASHIAQLVEDEDKAELKELSCHCIQNAFTDLLFCDPKCGINGATMAELLHVIQHGLFLCCHAGICGVKSLSKKKKKKTSESSNGSKAADSDENDPATELPAPLQDPDDSSDELGDAADDATDRDGLPQEGLPEDSEDLLDEFLSQFADPRVINNNKQCNGIFTETVSAQVDVWAKCFGRLLTHQSDRECDRAFFANGISSSAKKNGCEERCVLLLTLLVMCSSEGETLDKKYSEKKISSFVFVLSQLLMLENFFRSSEIRCGDIELIKQYIPIFMDSFAQATARETGMGMNFIKFHLLLHLCADLLRFGPPTSTDSSSGETRHKLFKADAERTQKNTDFFEEQVAQRHTESLAIELARRELERVHGTPNVAPTQSGISSRGLSFLVNEDGMFDHTKKPSESTPSAWINSMLMTQVTVFLQKHVLPSLPGDAVRLKNQAIVDGVLCRADPTCKDTSEQSFEIGRHDWVYLDWKEFGNVAARIVTFVELDEINTEIIDPATQDAFSEPGLHAVVQALAQDLDEKPEQEMREWDDFLAHGSTRIICRSELTHSDVPKGARTIKEPTLHLVNVEQYFHSPAIAVPFDPNENTDAIDWLVVEPRSKWSSTFRDLMKELIRK